MEQNKIAILERALQREKEARKQAERILEEKSQELFELNRKLKIAYRQKTGQVPCPEKTKTTQYGALYDAYIMIDLSGYVLKMNDAAINLLGLSQKKEPINVLDLVLRKDYIYALRSYRKLLKTGSFTDFVVRLKPLKGSPKIVHINSNLVYNGKDKPVAAEGILRDITEESRMRSLMEEQREQLSLIVNNSPVGIVLSGEGATKNTNKAFQDMLDYTKEEALNLTPQSLFPEEDLEKIGLLLRDMDNGTKNHAEFIQNIKKKDGSLITAKINMTAMMDHTRNVPYRLSLVEDISEKLRVEQQKEELMNRLEKSNQQLQEYAHVVSHDLKSPLRSIFALVSWIKEDNSGKLNDESLKNFSLIESTLEKMENLISGILSYSSITRNENEETIVDLQQVVKNILNLIYIPDHIQITIARKLPKIKGENIRMQQLFQNIIGNAIKYIDKEEGRILIDYEEKGNDWIFSVKDNGIGIAKEYHEKIFGMFQSLTPHVNSTGIGLSIVKKIVDLYGGSVYLESEEGVGTTFFIKLKR
jgi:PAS domain S-box-containing protein